MVKRLADNVILSRNRSWDLKLEFHRMQYWTAKSACLLKVKQENLLNF